MSDLLVAIILSVCPIPEHGVKITPCMEEVYNCADELHTLITEKSIKKCLEEHEKNK